MGLLAVIVIFVDLYLNKVSFASTRTEFYAKRYIQYSNIIGYSATYNKSYFDFLNIDQRPNSKIGDLLNIRYVITDKILDSSFIFKDSTQGLHLYEKPNFYPPYVLEKPIGHARAVN